MSEISEDSQSLTKGEVTLFETGSMQAAKLEQYKQNIIERKYYAACVYGLTQSWVGFLIVLTLAQFLLGKTKDFGLTEMEFNVVFTAATSSVLGYWYLVCRYLFNDKDDTKD